MGEEQGADNDSAILEHRSNDAGSANVECSRRSNVERYRASVFAWISVVGLRPAAQSLHGLGRLSVAEHVLALSDLCQSGMDTLPPLSRQGPAALFLMRSGRVLVPMRMLHFCRVTVKSATLWKRGHHARTCCFDPDRDYSGYLRLSFAGGACRRR
jgi:hypothetical protein